MYDFRLVQRAMIIGLLTALLAGGNALAQRDDGGRGGGRSGSGDGGGRSSNRGGGGGGESRSFSRGGGGGGGESRSFSQGGGGGGGGSRSFSRGSSESSPSMSRSFSGGGSTRSIQAESGKSSQSFRSDSGASRQSRPSDSGSSRSFSPQSRGEFQGARSGQEFNRGNAQFGGSNNNRSDTERQTFSPSNRGSLGSDQVRSRAGDDGQQTSDAQRRFGQGGQSNQEGQARQGGQQYQAGPNQGGQQYQARRANEEQVRNFLQMRGDNAQRQADVRGEATDGRSVRGDGNDERRAEVARRFEQSNRDGVKRNPNDANRGAGDLGKNLRDGNRGNDVDRDRDGKGDWDGRDRDGRNWDGRDRDFDRDGNVANRGDRDGKDRGDYQRWREGAWSRDRDDDHRDWSGRWRDGDRFDYARRVRDNWHDRDDRPFSSQWWTGHNHWHGDRWNWWGSHAHRHNQPYYWWARTTAPLLSSWVSFGWDRPYYWDYGAGEYIYCNDGVVYVNGRWHQPAPVFYERTVEIVDRAPELTPDAAAQLEWLPLGVFAVTPDGAAQADVLVQLAVTKDGVIGGTASNQSSGTAYAIEGMVDKQTQRAVWSYTDESNKRIVMETSIYNLTQPEATGLVHYGPDDFRVVQLVRLEEPATGSSSTTNSVGELPTP